MFLLELQRLIDVIDDVDYINSLMQKLIVDLLCCCYGKLLNVYWPLQAHL